MIDLIVYCPDTAALVAELRAKFPERLNEEDGDNPRFLVDKTPTRREGGATLALVRCREGDGTEDVLRALEADKVLQGAQHVRSEEHTSELQSR